jgi:maltose O-acetyltransferase
MLAVIFPTSVGLRFVWREFLANTLAASPFLSPRIRRALYRRYGIRIPLSSAIWPRGYVSGSDITIGERCYFNFGCFLDEGPIVIGDDCSFGMEVMLCTSSHELGESSRRGGAGTTKGITIGKGCWIGARAVILPGVTIGDGCVIAAGAVVTKDCEPNCLYGGNPARLIRELSSESDACERSALRSENSRMPA